MSTEKTLAQCPTNYLSDELFKIADLWNESDNSAIASVRKNENSKGNGFTVLGLLVS